MIFFHTYDLEVLSSATYNCLLGFCVFSGKSGWILRIHSLSIGIQFILNLLIKSYQNKYFNLQKHDQLLETIAWPYPFWLYRSGMVFCILCCMKFSLNLCIKRSACKLTHWTLNTVISLFFKGGVDTIYEIFQNLYSIYITEV